MKIAVASYSGKVSEHFGHCKEFMIFDMEKNHIVKSETISNPGHKPGFLPNFLADLGVNGCILFIYCYNLCYTIRMKSPWKYFLKILSIVIVIIISTITLSACGNANFNPNLEPQDT